MYIGNLEWKTTLDELKDFFSPYGQVTSAEIIKDRETGMAKGFGFVTMENADKAIQELNGKELRGRTVKLNEARERESSREYNPRHEDRPPRRESYPPRHRDDSPRNSYRDTPPPRNGYAPPPLPRRTYREAPPRESRYDRPEYREYEPNYNSRHYQAAEYREPYPQRRGRRFENDRGESFRGRKPY